MFAESRSKQIPSRKIKRHIIILSFFIDDETYTQVVKGFHS